MIGFRYKLIRKNEALISWFAIGDAASTIAFLE